VDGCCSEGFLFQGKERRLGEDGVLGLGLGLRFCLCCLPNMQNCPPLCVLWRPVFIGKNTTRFPTWPLNFFFIDLIFLIFLDFFYQHRLKWGKSVILKIMRYKSNAFPRSLKI
jgi:hypothetical protein